MWIELLALLFQAVEKHSNVSVNAEESPYRSLASGSSNLPNLSTEMLIGWRPNVDSWLSFQKVNVRLYPVASRVAQSIQEFITGSLPAGD